MSMFRHVCEDENTIVLNFTLGQMLEPQIIHFTVQAANVTEQDGWKCWLEQFSLSPSASAGMLSSLLFMCAVLALEQPHCLGGECGS